MGREGEGWLGGREGGRERGRRARGGTTRVTKLSVPFFASTQYKKGHTESAIHDACRTSSGGEHRDQHDS